MDHTKTCFVIMPYGSRKVEVGEGKTREIDFDAIYAAIFEPAIRETTLPEGGKLEPRRCDKDKFSAAITQDMFEYLEYARVAVADITGLNANAMYELGIRHRARPSGTIIVRQTAAPIPFDIKSIRAFAYDEQPAELAELARRTLAEELAATLLANRLDSPVQQALRAQHDIGTMDTLLRQAELEVRGEQWAKAGLTYRQALALQPTNGLILVRLGLLLKDQGDWNEALSCFKKAVAYSPNDAAALREQGIAENKLNGAADPDAGIDALMRAITLAPNDYDALSSLGGIYKRLKQYEKSADLYRRATESSRGDSYPLLNLLKLEAVVAGKLELDGARRFQLRRAEKTLTTQATQNPPIAAPWSFFDLAECRLYAGDADGFRKYVDDGLLAASAGWQAATFRKSLLLLQEGGVNLPGLAEGLASLEKAETLLS